jgi:polysaccharide deacetylase 2 family uncharacterized protein YibQ
LLTLFWVAGCKKKEPGRLAPATIHSISREFTGTARSSAPPGTQVRSVFSTPDKNGETFDRVDIFLPEFHTQSSELSALAKIQQSLGSIATRHGLTEEPVVSLEGRLFYYLKNGRLTHAIHIHTLYTAPPTENGPAQLKGAKLAIILDDLGSDRSAAEAIFALPYPLTISVLPNHEHSSEIANEALRRGYQVMLHLPMQALATEKPEAQELSPNMPEAEVSQLVSLFLQSVPGAVGVNNHQGSKATSDSALMGELMPVLREHHLFYIDSRTTAATVAYDTAQNSGVPSAFRNVPFLDDVTETGAVRKQLALALRDAREKGQAIAIGHPHAGTLQALREMLPKAQSQGVRLVFASELVH